MAERQQQQGVNFRDYLANIDQQISYFTKLKQQATDSLNRQYGDLNVPQQDSIWIKIDNEVANIDKYTADTLNADENYKNINAQLQAIVQQELLYLVRDKVEARQDGKSLLEKQLQLIRQIKSSASEKRNKDIDLFNRFKEYSRIHPETTYEQFLTKTL